MKTKYFSNSQTETLDDLNANVDKWISNHKILYIVERITSGPSKRDPSEFFIKLSYNDKPPRDQNTLAMPASTIRATKSNNKNR
ncbi:MAG: hypothetical protein H6Q72_2992 [Firmicutes bacterium]|nr:hypothetical protein [Bacillota bacterium]